MMKKLFLLLTMFFVCAGSVLAHELPRWFTQPVSVYIPAQSSYGATVKNAFASWQGVSGHLVRFVYNSSKKMENLSNIDVMFSESYNKNAPYKIQARYNSHYNSFNETGYFRRVGITIFTLDKEGKKLTNSQVYSIALRAAGESIGVKAFPPDQKKSKKKSVMSWDYEYDLKTLSEKDIYALKKVYLPNYRLKDKR